MCVERPAALILLAVWFASIPVFLHDSVMSKQLNPINGSSYVLHARALIFDREFNHTHCAKHCIFNSSLGVRLGRLPSSLLASGSLCSCGGELNHNVTATYRAKAVIGARYPIARRYGRRKEIEGICASRENLNAKEHKDSHGIFASEKCYRQVALIGNGSLELFRVQGSKLAESSGYIGSPRTSYLFNVPLEGRVSGHYISVGRASLLDVIPSRDSRHFEKASRSGADENQIIAECGNFAHRVTFNIWIAIPAFSNGAAIGRHGNFILRKVDNSHGAMLDLGYCRIRQNKEGSERLNIHLKLEFGEGSMVAADAEGRRIIMGVNAFVASHDGQWYQLGIRANSTGEEIN